jgi:hypothetical protein
VSYQHRRLAPKLTNATPWPRLLTLIGLLAVMFMIMNRAKDPHTWEWLTSESADADSSMEPEMQAGDETQGGEDGQRQDGNVVSNIESEQIDKSMRPTDQDPEESEAAVEEFQAVSDRAPLLREEMPSYWRLLNWARNQSIDELKGRSRRAAVFTDFVEAPDHHRGKLVHLRLHVMRSLSYETPDSPIGVKRLYEAWGWTEESGPWLYVVVFPEIPPGMPIGPDVRAEISFDGYFLKLMSYESHQSLGKPLFAPLLLGQVEWHPIQATSPSNASWFLMTAGAGGIILLTVVLRWILTFRSNQKPLGADRVQGNDEAVASWLRAEPD